MAKTPVDLETHELVPMPDRLSQLMSKVEQQYGRKFKAPIRGIANEDMTITSGLFSGLPGGMGECDYQNRTAIVDRTYIEKEGYNEDDVVVHELVHILERDVVGRELTHPHIVHATYDPEERQVLVDKSAIFSDDNLTQVRLLGATVAETIKTSGELTPTVIQTLETAFKLKFQLSRQKNVTLREQTSVFQANMDLEMIKIAYLAGIFAATNPSAVFEFEKAMQRVTPVGHLFYVPSHKIYQFSDEINTAVDVLVKQAKSPGEIGIMIDALKKTGEESFANLLTEKIAGRTFRWFSLRHLFRHGRF